MLRLVSPERAVIETNLGRRGFWLAMAGGARQLGLPLAAEDRMGVLTVEPGRRGALTVFELEVATWVCSRWREIGDPQVRRMPLGLGALAADFGWNASGANMRRLTLALDRLTDAAITAEVWAPGEAEARLRRRFHSFLAVAAAGGEHLCGGQDVLIDVHGGLAPAHGLQSSRHDVITAQRFYESTAHSLVTAGGPTSVCMTTQ